MPKQNCDCHRRIKTKPTDLVFKGQIIPKENHNSFYSKSAEEISEFIDAVSMRKGATWARKFYGLQDIKDVDCEDIIKDILTFAAINSALSIFQCSDCGKMYIETAPRSFEFTQFVPTYESAATAKLQKKEGALKRLWKLIASR